MFDTLPDSPQMGVSSVEFSESGRLMFVAYYDAFNQSQPSHLLVWDVLRGEPCSIVKTNVSHFFLVHLRYLSCVLHLTLLRFFRVVAALC